MIPEMAEEVRAPGPTQREPRVLVVDDSPDTVMVIQRYIERTTPIRCDGALNFDEAMTRMKNQDYEVLLTDLYIAGKLGTALVRTYLDAAVRKNAELASAIVMTGATDDTITSACLAAGASHVIEKPVNLDGLVQLLLKATQTETPKAANDTAPEDSAETDEYVISPAFDRPWAEIDPDVRELMPIFIEHRAKSLRAGLAEAHAPGDKLENLSTLLRAGHNIKGTSMTYELSCLSEHGARLESAARLGDGQVCERIATELLSALEKVAQLYARAVA